MKILGKEININVDYLNLSFFGEINIIELKKLIQLKNLKHLNISNSDLLDEHLKIIVQLEKLELLDLDLTEITDIGIRYLKPLKELQELRLKDNPQLTNNCINFLSDIEQLELIHIENTSITIEGLTKLLTQKKLKSMNKKTTLILVFFWFISFSQKNYIVTAKSGLSIRDKPSIKSNKIGKLNYKEKVTIVETTDFSFITENIKAYWVKIKTKDSKFGYVFNGFLKPHVEKKIIYSIIRSEKSIYQGLKAKINDREIIIINLNDKECFNIIETQDYNNNGFEEVLLESNACGGNCCGNSLYVYSFNGEKFTQSKHIGYYFGNKQLNVDKNNIRYFVVDDQNIGTGNTTLCEDKKETYIFDDLNFKLISTKTDNKLKAIIELKASDFESNNHNKTLSIKYDLDNNGIMDEITSEYWDRWGILHNSKIILNNKILKSDILDSTKRIGVIKSKTNNVNDLVIECNKILKWDGYNYQEK